MPRTVHVLDPGFTEAVGHHRSYNEALGQAAAARGEALRVLAHGCCPAIEEAPYTLVRSFAIDEAYRREPVEADRLAADSAQVIDRLGQDLDRDLTPAVHSGDTVVVHTLRHRLLAALVAWLRRCPVRPIRLSLRFNNRASRSDRGDVQAYAEAAARRAFAEANVMDDVVLALYAETPDLVEYYRDLAGRAVAEMPPLVPFDRAPLPLTSPVPGAPWVAFLGALREEKGANLLAPAFEALARHRPQVRFRLQDLHGTAGPGTLPAKVLDRMEITRRSLAPSACYSLIQGSSAVAVPYDP